MIRVFTYDNSKIEQKIAEIVKDKLPAMDSKAIKNLIQHQWRYMAKQMEEEVPYIPRPVLGRWVFNPKHKEQHLKNKNLNQENNG